PQRSGKHRASGRRLPSVRRALCTRHRTQPRSHRGKPGKEPHACHGAESPHWLRQGGGHRQERPERGHHLETGSARAGLRHGRTMRTVDRSHGHDAAVLRPLPWGPSLLGERDMKIGVRRVYDPPESGEGLRVLVDRLWPRGIRKQDLEYDVWEKELAPTPELRKWFGHKPERWEEFQKRYQQELDNASTQERLRALVKSADKRNLTLLYGARDPQHNHALILADALKRLY